MDIQGLKKYVPFSELDDKYLEDVLEHIGTRSFKKGEMLFKRGRSVAERYYLVSGNVDLIDANYNAVNLRVEVEEAANPLNPESPTKCSCIAKSPVEVFTIETATLDRIVSWSESAAYANEFEEEMLSGNTGEMEVASIAEEDASDWMSSMLQSPLFTRIPMTQVQELFCRFTDVDADAGDVIIKEGERGDYFYVVASGKARVTNRLESVDVTLEPGDYFGEEALLGNTLRNATVTMAAKGKLKRLDGEVFEMLLKEPILEYVLEDELDKLGKPHKILDVKMPLEYRMFHVPGSINVPLSRLRSSMQELAQSCAYVVPSDAGSRADIAAHLLCQAGFDAYILKAPIEEES